MGKDINAPKPIAAFFHSFSQVVLVENVISGALILAAFFVWSWEVSNYHIGILAIVAAIVGNVTAKALGNDDDAIAAGLFGFSPVLVGAAAAVFYAQDGIVIDAYIFAILGSMLAVPLQLIINGLCAKLNLPGFTMPFIAITWFFALVSKNSGILTACGWMSPEPIAGALVEANAAGAAVASFSNVEWVNALTKGFGEVFLLDTVYGSLLMIVAFAVDNWKNAIKLIGVSLFMIVMAVIFQASAGTLNAGVYTYNPILLLMGMEVFSKNKDNPARYWFLIVLGLLTVGLVDYALPSIVGTFGLSNLTFPFVLVTWGLLFLEQKLPENFLAK